MIQLSSLAPEQRRVILVLAETDMRAARRDPGVDDLFDHPEVVVVPLPTGDEPDEDPLISRLRRGNLLRPGALLVQSPYDVNAYERADQAFAEFAVAKFMLLSQLCGLLGAKSVTTEQVKAVRRKASHHGEARGRAPVGSANGSVDYDLERLVQQRLEVADKFAGTNSNVANARSLLEEHGLMGDPVFSSLAALREGDNPVTSREISLSLIDTSSTSLRVASEVAGLKVVKVNADFQQRLEEELEVTVKVAVTF